MKDIDPHWSKDFARIKKKEKNWVYGEPNGSPIRIEDLKDLVFAPYATPRVAGLEGIIAGCSTSTLSVTREQDMNWVANLHARKRAAAPHGDNQAQTTALLLALQEGTAGERILGEWARLVETSDDELPPIWALVSYENTSILAMLRDLAPTVQPFLVDEDASWATVIRNFQAEVCRFRIVYNVP